MSIANLVRQFPAVLKKFSWDLLLSAMSATCFPSVLDDNCSKETTHCSLAHGDPRTDLSNYYEIMTLNTNPVGISARQACVYLGRHWKQGGPWEKTGRAPAANDHS